MRGNPFEPLPPLYGVASDDDGDLDGLGRAMRGKSLLDTLEREPVRDEPVDLDHARGQEPDGLRKLLLVDHGADDGELATHHPEEAHRRRFVRQPRENEAAAGTNELDGLLDGRARARRLDEQIDPLAAGKASRDFESATRARGGELVGAELAGQALASRGAADGQDLEPPRLQQLDGE